MEFKVASRTTVDEQGKTRRYSYSLLVDQVEGPNFACENYGVCVLEEGGERACIPGITTSAMRIDELISLLVEHKVSPTVLSDVVADWL